jgi:xanthine dehydrogenase accessory factor
MIILIRGGGDLASGVALRLHRVGLRVVMTELPQPLAVRRLVSFSEAVGAGEVTVEGITAKRVNDPADTVHIMNVLGNGHIPVLIDPESLAIGYLHPTAVVDARLLKQVVSLPAARVNLLVGLGPGFRPGANCHAAVETARGPWLGRVYWNTSPLEDTGVPDSVMSQSNTRVLRAPIDGVLEIHAAIGDVLEAGQLIAHVGGQNVMAAFHGVLRGLLPGGMPVIAGLKIGDLDPRADPLLCKFVSDKALAVGGGVLEAILSRPELREKLWT